jgi:hypothetical protein
LFKRKYVWAIVYGVLLTAFTIYVALDTFVITRVYYTVPSEQNQQSASSEYVATEYQTAEQEDAATNQSTDEILATVRIAMVMQIIAIQMRMFKSPLPNIGSITQIFM